MDMGKDNEIIITEIERIQGIVNVLSKSELELSKKIDIFIGEILAKTNPPTMSLNIYQGEGKDAEIRRENLRFYLNFYLKEITKLKIKKKSGPLYLFVGEAPGRWGCFQTGIPFTDINTLVENVFFEERRNKLGNGKELEKDELISLHIASSKEKILKKEISERSSTVVWKCIDELPRSEDGKLPLFWNIYPYHPSDKSNEYTLSYDRPNRRPNALERALGVEFLFGLLELFKNEENNKRCYIEKIYAVGKNSYNTLKLKRTFGRFKKEFPEIELELKDWIYHPAARNGGAEKFREKFKTIMGSILYMESKPKNKKK